MMTVRGIAHSIGLIVLMVVIVSEILNIAIKIVRRKIKIKKDNEQCCASMFR